MRGGSSLWHSDPWNHLVAHRRRGPIGSDSAESAPGVGDCPGGARRQCDHRFALDPGGHGTLRVGQITPWGLISGGFVARLLLVNLVLVVFNLIPAFPMDGGRVLRRCLALLTDYCTATRIAVRVGQVAAVALGMVGFLLLHNALLPLIAAFVFFAAEGELRQSLRETLGPASAIARRTPLPTPSHVTETPSRWATIPTWNRPSPPPPGIVTVVVWPDVPDARQLD